MTSGQRPVCLVTGGAQRIGLAIVQALAPEFDVAIHANSSVDEAERLARELNGPGRRAHAFQADFAEPRSAGSMVAQAATYFGRLDLVVNSASVFAYDTPATFDVAGMQQSLSINLVAQMAVAQAFGEVASQDGLLVNMLDNKVFAPNPDFFSYSLAKFALRGATDMLAMHYRGRLRVCAIAPSNTLISGDQTQAEFAKGWARTLTGAGPTPADIADTVRYLWRTKSINAQTVVLDGGQRLMSLQRDVAFEADQ